MAGSVNKVILVGNVGADPEIRSTQAGKRVANMRIATSDSWTDKESGEKRERTAWHTIVCFSDGLVGVIEKYVQKGAKVYVEGQSQTRKWADKGGNDRYSTEVVIQGFGGGLQILSGGSSGTRPTPTMETDVEPNEDLNDDFTI
jgi:single-strand DNA-binding protein